MRILFVTLLLAAGLSASFGKDLKYPVDAIPEQLLNNVNVVFRLERGEFTIEKIDRAKFKVHQVISIMNEKGSAYALVGVGYDKLRKLSFTSAYVYNKKGEEIYKLKKSDIIDESNISGYSLYEDNRIQGIDLRQKDYPYTIEVEYEIQYKYLYGIPDWYVIPGEKVSIERSEFIVNAPANLKPRFKEINIESNTMKTTLEEGLEKFQWVFQNLSGIELEPFSKGALDMAPIIRASPSKFSYEGYEGDMSTWNGLGRWQNLLNKGRDVLSQNTIAEIQKIVEGVTSREEKVKRVYQYMQKKTRYVSIQLGIGGFQPMEAAVVDETGYGDCKALTNYTQSLLKAAGIQSYYTWVDAGNNPDPVYEDFPNDSFNHIILCVPNEADTIWLECTNQTIPFGYLGKFTSDRKVLVINETGGKIVKTPSYDYQNNMITNHATIILEEEGNAHATVKRTFTGLAYEYDNLDYYLTLTDKDREDWLHENIAVANYELGAYEFREDKAVIPSAELNLELKTRKLASISGKRVFLTLNFMSLNEYVPKSNEQRKAPVYLKYSSTTYDTIIYKLPQNLSIEFVPEETEIQSNFGYYHMNVQKKEDEIIYYRQLKLNKGKYDPEEYNNLVDFLKNIRSADRKKAVFLNKT